ncbi:hypothetical protein M758_4G147900 [Ceratodon purpureus]|nr:hypothetical protein M758_4G147900 [Ceratodon purpureus]
MSSCEENIRTCRNMKNLNMVSREGFEELWFRKRRVESIGEAGSSTTGRKNGYVNLETLECPVCFEIFSGHVFQCPNGLTVCAACCKKIKGCPSCSTPIEQYIRCRAIESVIDTLRVECKHARHGCKTMVKYSKKDEHDSWCGYQQMECPLQVKYGWMAGCEAYKGSKSTIPRHLEEEHNVQIVECPKSARSASFEVTISGNFVMLKAKEAWLLLFWRMISDPDKGLKFYCYSFEALKQVEYKLTVKPVSLNGKSKKVYSIQDVVFGVYLPDVDGEEFGYLSVPG